MATALAALAFAAPLGCGPATPLVAASPQVGPGARAGPIWFVTGGSGRASVQLEPHYPDAVFATKVLVYLRRPLRDDVTLSGSRCSDGTPLRFWYRSRRLPLPPDPVPAERLAEVGDLNATLRRGRPPIIAPTLGYGGYILFSAPGYWRVLVRQRGRVVGSAVFRVTA